MRTIWKFSIGQTKAAVKMPIGAKPLAVQVQGDEACLWAEVDSDAETETRHFRIFGTGHDMPSGMGYSDVYLGTFQQGPFMWHLYELTGT